MILELLFIFFKSEWKKYCQEHLWQKGFVTKKKQEKW